VQRRFGLQMKTEMMNGKIRIHSRLPFQNTDSPHVYGSQKLYSIDHLFR
jgi:hypothetical protein